MEEAVTEEEVSTEQLMQPRRLYEIRLPAGDVGSINIDWFRNGASINLHSSDWLSQGYAGVRIIGDGRTQVRGGAWDGRSIAIGRHKGIVQLDGITVWPGDPTGIAICAGEQNLSKVLVPEFQLHFINSQMLTSPETRGKWGIFSYNCDLLYRDSRFDGTFLYEHDSYNHGAANIGARIIRCSFDGAGAECLKFRPDVTETAPLPHIPSIEVENSIFKNWYQDWSWRGGAAIVLQNASAHLKVFGCLFFPGAATAQVPRHQRSRCLMVTSEGNGYPVDSRFGNGIVNVTQCGFTGGPGPDWLASIIRCGRNSGSFIPAKAFVMEDCGVWGSNMQVQLADMLPGRVRVAGCNTPEIRQLSSDLGLNPIAEAVIPTSQRLVPVSEGYAA